MKRWIKIFLITLGILIVLGLFLLFTGQGRAILEITVIPIVIPFSEPCGNFGGFGTNMISESCDCDGLLFSEGKDGPSQTYCFGECSTTCKCYNLSTKSILNNNSYYISSTKVPC